MQLLIQFGAPAVAIWLASNIFLVVGWCWCCSRRIRRTNNMRLPSTMLPMGDILPFRTSRPASLGSLRQATVQQIVRASGIGAI